MSNALHHHEHSEHAAHAGGFGKRAALLIAICAALLALCEQGAKHAEIHASESSIAAADIWAEYQAKSVRAAQVTALGELAATLETPGDPALAAKRAALFKTYENDRHGYDDDPKRGRKALAEKATGLEEARDRALVRVEAYDNASAALELAIVLSTASVITSAAALLVGAAALAVLGAGLGLLAVVAPALGTF